MAKKVLSIDYEYDFKILGISSGLKDYRLCWFLNRVMGFELYRTEDLLLPQKKNAGSGSAPIFTRFEYLFETETEREIHLIVNRGTESFFVPEKKQIDYFLVLKEWHDPQALQRLKEQIRSVGQVTYLFEIDPLELKSKDNFLHV